MVAWSSGPSAPAPRAPSPSGPSSGPRWSPPRTRTSESRGGRILWVPESRSRLLPGLSSSGSRLRPNSGWFPPVIAKTRGNREEQRGKPRHPGRGPSRSAQFRRTVSQFRSAGSTQRTVRGQTFVTKRSPEVGTFFATCSPWFIRFTHVPEIDSRDVVTTSQWVDELHEEESWFAGGSQSVPPQEIEECRQQRSA